MSARVVRLSNFVYNEHNLDTLWLIIDEHKQPPLLPLLFTTHLSRFGTIYDICEESNRTNGLRISSLVTREISDSTIRSYVYGLARFLSYLETCQSNHQTPGMHSSSACNNRFVNNYLNIFLPTEVNSAQTLDTNRSALIAYFNWLDYMEVSPRLELKIYRKTRQYIAEKNNKQYYIQYVSRYWRTKLINACETLGEKLIIRMGVEVGLRTSELLGIRDSGKNGIVELFKQLNENDFDHVNQFRYWLKGTYTKGSKSRWIYFNRSLLVDMKRYFETERRWIINNSKSNDTSFFLKRDHRFIGTGIGKEQGSRVFRKRSQQAGLNSNLTFHDLRHTFATDLYHEELSDSNGRETRSESAALLIVAQRLGHSIGRNGLASDVTTRYIRIRLQMIEMEETI